MLLTNFLSHIICKTIEKLNGNKIVFKEHGVCSMSSVTLIRYFYPNISGWPWPLGTQKIITQHVSAAMFKIMGPTYWCHELNLTRSHDIIDHMTTLLAIYAISYWCHTGNEPLYSTVFKVYCIQNPNITGSRPWPFRVTWRHRPRDSLISQVSFPMMLYWDRVSISSHFRDNGRQT